MIFRFSITISMIILTITYDFTSSARTAINTIIPEIMSDPGEDTEREIEQEIHVIHQPRLNEKEGTVVRTKKEGRTFWQKIQMDNVRLDESVSNVQILYKHLITERQILPII